MDAVDDAKEVLKNGTRPDIMDEVKKVFVGEDRNKTSLAKDSNFDRMIHGGAEKEHEKPKQEAP